MVIPSKNRGSGRFRARQVERILSGDEARDPVGAFLAEMVQDLRDVSRAEVPSSVAARHLLKMRMATEMGEGGPEPLLDVEEPALPPARPLERRRRTVAALGLAAAMVVMVGVAASITGPRDGGTRAGGIVRNDVPPLQDDPGRFDRFVTNEARSSASTREPDQSPSGGSTGPAGGASSGQPAGVIDGQGSPQPAGSGTGGGGGSGGANTGSGDEPGSGGGSGSGGDVGGRGKGGDANRGPKDKGDGKGRGKGGGKSGDRAQAGGETEKGSSKKP
jgi:hypothetical protein